MSVASLDQYLDAVREGDPAKLSATLANDIVMHGPLVSEPIAGRDQVAPVLGFAFGFVDEFRFGDVLTGPDVFAIPFTGTVGDEELEGMEYLHVDGQGKVDLFTAYIRPLPALVAFQNKLAPVLGLPAMALAPLPLELSGDDTE